MKSLMPKNEVRKDPQVADALKRTTSEVAKRLAALDMIELCGDRPQAVPQAGAKGFDTADIFNSLLIGRIL